MTRVAFLWHMHQPYYEDLVTGEHILPWVRLHALKDYYGMVALADEFPSIRMTFNLVPSLLVQLGAFAANRARDRVLDLSLKPVAALSPDETAFIIQHFFHAQRQRMIEPHPRYAELLAERGPISTPGEAHAVVRRFSADDLCDLQVWHKLAWLDPFYQDRDSRVRALVGKGRGFSEADKQLLRTIELELLNAVIPAYRVAAGRGQIEIATSPFYHPILPLVCDTDIYKRTHPESPMPRHRFVHPEDARKQLTRASDLHERLFGRRPVGLWPSEGSVSNAMVPLAAEAGFEWMATDELILARTVGMVFTRDGQGHLDQPERLYQPYVVSAGGARVACAFRDHFLSDLIGFTYAGWPSDRAAEDFVGRLVEAGRRYTARGGRGEPLISIVLDGENAWEHYESGGRPFLRALYGRLSSQRELRTVTMGEACRGAQAELTEIFPGSWIDANFYIWIGHHDDRRAWSQLAEAREALTAPGHVDPSALELAREEVLIAEGSDWFWWYGDDHSSDQDAEFDDLFRRHLRNVYRLLQKPVPDELFTTNISAAAPSPTATAPTGLVHPTLDGEETSYFEWLGAGRFDVRDTMGAMHQTDRRATLLTSIQFGFDRQRFYLRLDGERPMREVLALGHEVSLIFLTPAGVRFSIRQTDGQIGGALAHTAGTILELAIPVSALGPVSAVALFVAVHDAQGAELERHPPNRPIEVGVPDAAFESRQWSA